MASEATPDSLPSAGGSAETERYITPEQAYLLLRSVGFDRDRAIWLTAAAYGESRFDTQAHARDADDDSYGLWQINLKGRLRSRLAEWGLSSPDELFDPLTNAQAAFNLSGGGRTLSPWGIFSGDARDRSAKRHYAEAQAAADRADSYAPVPEPKTPCDEQKIEPQAELQGCYVEVPHE